MEEKPSHPNNYENGSISNLQIKEKKEAQKSNSTQSFMEQKKQGWDILESLASSQPIATIILRSSAWLELLGVLVGFSKFTQLITARVGAAKVLSKLLWDPNTGPSASTFPIED